MCCVERSEYDIPSRKMGANKGLVKLPVDVVVWLFWAWVLRSLVALAPVEGRSRIRPPRLKKRWGGTHGAV